MLGITSVLNIGMFDPKNRDRSQLDIMKDELKYMAEKLGISKEEPPSN